MRPLLAVTLSALVAAACTIEPTPREYIDRQPPTGEVRERAIAALEGRVRSALQALRAGDGEAARAALNPAPEAIFIGPDGVTDLAPDRFDALLELATQLRPLDIELRDLEVEIGPRGSVGWFAARARLSLPGAGESEVRLTGVFAEREGTWELRLAHVSTPAPVLRAAPAAPATAPARGEAG